MQEGRQNDRRMHLQLLLKEQVGGRWLAFAVLAATSALKMKQMDCARTMHCLVRNSKKRLLTHRRHVIARKARLQRNESASRRLVERLNQSPSSPVRPVAFTQVRHELRNQAAQEDAETIRLHEQAMARLLVDREGQLLREKELRQVGTERGQTACAI